MCAVNQKREATKPTFVVSENENKPITKWLSCVYGMQTHFFCLRNRRGHSALWHCSIAFKRHKTEEAILAKLCVRKMQREIKRKKEMRNEKQAFACCCFRVRKTEHRERER